MPRSFDASLKAHYALGTTTISQFWRAQLRDGTVVAATTHTSDITIDGVQYVASQGYNPSNVESSADLSVDNMEVDGYLAAPGLTVDDVHSGRWDYASIILFEANPNNLAQGINILRSGTLGQVKAGRSIFTAELRGLTQKYARRIVTLTTQECQADFGDDRCKMDKLDWTVLGTVAHVENNKIISDASRTEAADWFTGGLLTFTSGLNSGIGIEVKSYSPGVITLFEAPPFRVTATDSDPGKTEAPPPPDTYSMYVGCQKRFYQDCLGKFNNGINFRGCPHLPGSNVFGMYGSKMTPASVPASGAHSPPPPPVPGGAPGPAPAPDGVVANKVLATYFEVYRDGDALRMTDVPLDFNVIYIFNAKFTGDGGVTYSSATTNASHIQTCRNRGQKCILTVGGSDSKFVFSTRAQSTAFLSSVQGVISTLGGVDGVDFNNYEGSNQPAAEMVYIAQQLKQIYGPNFAITSPAAGNSGLISEPDGAMIKALNDAGVLTYVNPQYYDWSGYKVADWVKDHAGQWVTLLGDASKVVVGLSANYNGPPGSGPYQNALTLPECIREYDALEAIYPNIRGAFCWNAYTDIVTGGNEWGSTMRTHVGNSLAAPPPPAPVPAPAPQPGGGTPLPGGGTIPFDVGVNMQDVGSSTGQNATIVSLLTSRGIRTVRLNLFTTTDTLQRDFVSKCSAAGIQVQGIVMTSAQSDHAIYTGGALTTWQATNNSEAAALVNTYYALGVRDFELLNEIPLRSEMQAQVTAYDAANANESTYTGKTAFISIASALKGMAAAVHAKAGARVILGTIGRDWGFLKYMTTLGVSWDVVGYHIYPREGDASLQTDTWFGTGGLVGQLAALGKPVTINEFNAGEIYDAYENTAGQPVTEAGFRSVAKHMKELYSQTQCTLDSVCFYELLDEPAKSPPENRFGLMYDLSTPKVSLYLAAAFAGGTLTTTERNAITSRTGLLTSSEIDAMQPAAAPAPGPAPVPPPPATGGWGSYPAIPLVSPVPERWLQTGPSNLAYWAEDNPWGSAGLTRGTFTTVDGSTYESAYGVKPAPYGPNGEVAGRFAWKFPKGDLVNHEVKGYPSLISGRKPGYFNTGPNPGGIPVLLPDGSYSGTSPSGATPGTFLPLAANGRMSPVNSSFAWQHNITPTGQGHLTFDIWLQDRAQQTSGFGVPPITHEIMIPLDYWGGYGRHPDGRPREWYSHDVTIQGVLWHVYMARNFSSGWTFIVFEPDAPLSPAGRSLNLAEFLNHITTRTDSSGQRWANGTEWLSSIELGVEPVWGVGDLALTNFRTWQG